MVHTFRQTGVGLLSCCLDAAGVLPHQRGIDMGPAGDFGHVEEREIFKKRLEVVLVKEIYGSGFSAALLIFLLRLFHTGGQILLGGFYGRPCAVQTALIHVLLRAAPVRPVRSLGNHNNNFLHRFISFSPKFQKKSSFYHAAAGPENWPRLLPSQILQDLQRGSCWNLACVPRHSLGLSRRRIGPLVMPLSVLGQKASRFS